MITLICPFCGGDIPYDSTPAVICRYCDSKVLVSQAPADAPPEQDKPSELEQAVADFKSAWSKANRRANGLADEFYIITSNYYKLCSLTHEPEVEIIEKSLYELERKLQKLSGLQRITYYVRNHIRLFLGIMMAVFVGTMYISGRLGISGDGRFVAVIGFLMFASVMGYIVLAFRTWGMENWMKSGNQPEKKAITEAINKLQKKAKKANKKKSDEGS